jgi:hypothetical protein
MPEPFGKRNRRTVSKPAVAKRARHRRSAPSSHQAQIGPKKIHFYIVGGILFLVLAGYALAT